MLTLKESFQNVKVVCHNALMKREEWLTIDESLSNIAGALQAYELMLQEAEIKGKDGEPKLEDEPDEDKD